MMMVLLLLLLLMLLQLLLLLHEVLQALLLLHLDGRRRERQLLLQMLLLQVLLLLLRRRDPRGVRWFCRGVLLLLHGFHSVSRNFTTGISPGISCLARSFLPRTTSLIIHGLSILPQLLLQVTDGG